MQSRLTAPFVLGLAIVFAIGFGLGLLSVSSVHADQPIEISGIYPHLTLRNDEQECGTGAVVPWQGSLWIVTYAPHAPTGSSDKLYEITPELEQRIFPESVGGTPANRMIHREKGQLLIGPYLVDGEKNIRVLGPDRMFGRLTGNARHLDRPGELIYYATMEEGLYEVDLDSLDVTCLIRDNHEHSPDAGVPSKLPGYHGKGLYSGQGRVVYSNNGDHDRRNRHDPTIPSGALAEWFGEGDWRMVRRNQFTEVTGPGGIHGNANPESDPVWAMGWDARSVILALLEDEKWHYYRLPKGSHSYDGSHGWNTEWPRIREIGEEDLLATMHGTFWRFPAAFSRANTAGIAPRSNYLKVIGDFCRWDDRVVLGCDDSAKSEFINRRPFKSEHAAPLQSNSNLWFIAPERLDQLGPAIGRGSVWLRDDVAAGAVSEPFLFSGYDHRQLSIIHETASPVELDLEVDREGNGVWSSLRRITVPAEGSTWLLFDPSETGAWIRLRSRKAVDSLTAHFHYRDRDPRDAVPDDMFDGIARADSSPAKFGLMRSLAYDRLGVLASDTTDGDDAACYVLTPSMELVPVEDAGKSARLVAEATQPRGVATIDEASVLLVEDGRRYRLPIGSETLTPDSGSDSADEPADTLAEHLADSLALGASVTASSVHADYAPDLAVDGRLGDESRWIGAANDIPSIEIDLGEPKTFRSVWIASGWKNDPAYAASDFDLQIESDGQWRTAPGGEVRGNRDLERGIELLETVTARRVRLAAKDSGYFRIAEIAIFEGTPPISRDPSLDYGVTRVCREVATERDLLNVAGTFYELPARNAQGLAKIRPVATHELALHDFCSHNGLLLFTGIDAETVGPHIFRSADGQAAVWAGVVDDLWKLGKPHGNGGPWKDTEVRADTPSDPYLMTAYDEKIVTLEATDATTVILEVDVDGTGVWIPYRSFELAAGEAVRHRFPDGFSAYWIRATSSANTTASVQFVYR